MPRRAAQSRQRPRDGQGRAARLVRAGLHRRGRCALARRRAAGAGGAGGGRCAGVRRAFTSSPGAPAAASAGGGAGGAAAGVRAGERRATAGEPGDAQRAADREPARRLLGRGQPAVGGPRRRAGGGWQLAAGRGQRSGRQLRVLRPDGAAGAAGAGGARGHLRKLAADPGRWCTDRIC